MRRAADPSSLLAPLTLVNFMDWLTCVLCLVLFNFGADALGGFGESNLDETMSLSGDEDVRKW